ncbi:hypothetical protein [Vibrio diabolicus]|uniref:hypothetical protein n=1 Tax=Vibrio diabolicus TaxID=50719 RepID=UPI002480FBCF|nr:hypothetical protein [Vibrio diabolicus]
MQKNNSESKSRFDQVLDQASVETPTLPLIHNCDGYVFRSILESQKIKAFQCDTFVNDSLIYFYYGRPAYRVSKDKNSTSLKSSYPVCIVMSPPANLNPKRMFPLDSGAFAANMFSDFFHQDIEIENLSLKPEIESAGKIVSYFFGSNSNYLKSEPKNIKVNPLDFEIQSYEELISANSKTNYDDRRATIELQYDQSIALSESNVRLIIMPNCFRDDPLVLKKIELWGCECETYYTFHWKADEYTSIIYDKLFSYFSKNGLLVC